MTLPLDGVPGLLSGENRYDDIPDEGVAGLAPGDMSCWDAEGVPGPLLGMYIFSEEGESSGKKLSPSKILLQNFIFGKKFCL